MAVLALILSILLAIAGLWLGIALSLDRKWVGLSAVVAGLAVIAVRGVLAYSPGLEERLYELDNYPYFALTFSTAAATMVLAFLARKVARKLLAVLLWVLCVLLVLQEGYYSLQFVLAERWYARLEGKVDATGYCPQTSEYTCGAAAGAMLLHAAGVAANEEEMARLCLVRAGIGVTDLTLLRGIKRKLRGTAYTAQVLRALTYDQLLVLPKPCLVSIRQGWLLDHTVIVRFMNRRALRLLDPEPRLGPHDYSRPRFERIWRGDAMVLRKMGESRRADAIEP